MHIAYASADDGVWLMQVDGSHHRQILPPGDPGMVEDYGLGFTPDSRVLAWDACCTEHTVALIERGKLIPVIQGDDPFPLVFQDWLPSGSGILFSHPDLDPDYDALYSTGKAGYALREYRLTHHLATAIWQARFSPDGRFLLLAYSTGPVSIQVHTVTIAVLDIRNGQRHVLLQGLADNLGSPTWSPDGKQIAYVACPTPREQRCPVHDIWVMDADGSHRRNVTRGALADVQAVSWTPGALSPLPRFMLQG
jgi:WD40 repeat protein